MEMIELDRLHYCWADPPFNHRNRHQNPKWVKRYRCHELELLDGAKPWVGVPPNQLNSDQRRARRIWEISQDMKVRGMLNPLVVHRITDNFYTVLKGNERLCCIRGTEDVPVRVPCRISPTWFANEVVQAHPYFPTHFDDGPSKVEDVNDTVAVAGLWELGWNNPLMESYQWTFVLRDFGVKRWYMSPVTGIIHNEHRNGVIDLKEANDFQDILDLGEDLTRVYVDEKAETLLPHFDHPRNALYIFGRAGVSTMNAHRREGDLAVKIPTVQNKGVLWPHQCLLTVLYDREIKSWPSS